MNTFDSSRKPPTPATPGLRLPTLWIAGAALLGIAAFMPGCDQGTPLGHSGAGTAQKAMKYYCTMHPSYTSDRPGSCPICGMNLDPMPEQTTSGVVLGDRASFTATPERLQLSGVQLGKVEKRPFSKVIRAVGRLEPNERLLSTVTLKFGGWIERLFVNAEGDGVPKGAPLFEVYSPELLEAQRNFLIALNASGDAGFASQNVKSARDRLLLWDITEEQLKALETSREPSVRMPILSKVEGFVLRRNIVLGAYVEPGTNLYEIADLSTLWVKTDVYEHEMPDLRVGLPAEVQLGSRSGPPIAGKVAFIYPYLDERTRTVGARIEVSNSDGSLKPGMFGTVSIRVDMGEQLVVDDQAILDSGTRKIVFVSTGEGRFEPREVVTGARADGAVAVLKGLTEGEQVVTSANFLVDSESRLKAVFSRAVDKQRDEK